MNIHPQTPKTTVSETVFKSILRGLRENILTSFTALFENL